MVTCSPGVETVNLITTGVNSPGTIDSEVMDNTTYNFQTKCVFINSYLTNGFSHHYHLGGSSFVFRGVRCNF